MRFKWKISFIILAFLVLLLPISGDLGLSRSSNGENLVFLVKGEVFDIESNDPLSNFTITFSAELFKMKQLRTNGNGSYEIQLPDRNYTISIYNTKGEMVERLSRHIAKADQIDFPVYPDKILKSRIKGTILGKDDDKLEGARIILRNKENHTKFKEALTDEDGHYDLVIEPGAYILTVHYNEILHHEDNLTLEPGDTVEWENIQIEAGEDKPIITIEDVSEFLLDHWLNMLFLFLTILLIVLFYIVILAVLNFFRKKRFKFLESDWFSITRTFITGLALLGILLVLSYQISRMFPTIEEYSWDLMKQVAGPAIGILVVVFVSRLLLHANKDLWGRFKGTKKTTIKTIPQQLISMISIIFRYLIILIALVLTMIFILSAFGLKQEIWDVVGDFFKDNAGKMGFLVILVIAAVLMKKFIDLFFKELSTRSSKMSPQILDMSQRGSTGLTYFIITLIFLYTLLSIGGLGAIGETFILVISMMVGLVVSFAATGSIGNMLSGLVLMSMKPFDIDDRVKIGNGTIGDVTVMGVMFTRIKNLDSELQDIPNNIVLANGITNYSQAARNGGFAVVVDVSLGYDINPRTARALMKRAALASPGVLKEPTPKIIVKAFLDHAVEYRLRSYIDNPKNMLNIRSSIMESMMMAFHTEGLEILSPLHHVRRIGKEPTLEELDHRVSYHTEAKSQEAAAEGLTMFDTLEKI